MPTTHLESRSRPIRSLGVEFPVEDDPTKLHGVIVESGESRWRAECMACGTMSALQDQPGAARAAAIRHANGEAHRVRVARARKAQADG